MKHKGTKIIAVISITLLTLVTAAAVRIHYRHSLFGNYKRSVVNQAIAPDGKMAADEIVEVYDIGIGSPVSTMVAIGDGDDKKIVFEIDGGNVDMAWKDSHHLVIGYPYHADVFTKEDSYDDASIQYIAEK